MARVLMVACVLLAMIPGGRFSPGDFTSIGRDGARADAQETVQGPFPTSGEDETVDEEPVPVEAAPAQAEPEVLVPTDTPVPTPTETPTPVPTNTPAPVETAAPTPLPTATATAVTSGPAEPVPTATPVPTRIRGAAPARGTSGDFAAARIVELTLVITLTPGNQVTVGTSVSGRVNFPGINLPTGTVTYTVFEGDSCSGPVYADAGRKVLFLGSYSSDSILFSTPGTYSWLGAYSGDLIHNPGTICQTLTVTKTVPTLNLTVAPTTSPMRAGGTARGTAALTGATATAGGTVTYAAYSDSTCTKVLTAPGNQNNEVTVSNRTVPSSAPITFDQVGTVYWRAVYSGDNNNSPSTSQCVALTVAKAAPSVTVSASPSPATVANSITFRSTLANATGQAGGTLTYTVFTSSTCTTQLSLTGNPSMVSLTNGTAPPSGGLVFATTGTFGVRAAYAGDANNEAISSTCTPFTVGNAAPAVGLTIEPATSPLPVGSTARGVATLTGQSATASGTMVYTVYTNATCTTQYTLTGNPSTSTVSNGVAAKSTALTFGTTGTFYWKAVYSGNTVNNGASSGCIPMVVGKSTPTVTLSVSPNPVSVGQNVTGTATLTGATSTATGTMTYRVYSDSACTTAVNPAQVSIKTLSGGVAPASDALPMRPVGTLYWQAAYSGDTANNTASSACIPVTVTKATPTLTLTQSPNSVAIGGAYTTHLTISANAVTPTGTVTLTSYSDSACTTAIAGSTYVATLSGGTIPNPPAATFNGPRIFYRTATYSGDANNAAASTGCIPLGIIRGPLTASVTGVTLPSVGYSNTGQINSGVLQVTVSDERATADGWSVTLSTSDFAYSGSSPRGAAIPATNLAISSVGTPTATRGQPIGAGGPSAAPAAVGTFGQTRTVLVAAPGYGSGAYTATVGISLTIPPASQTGTYKATVTVLTAAAP